MNPIVLFKTESGNNYAYDYKANQILLCHPVLNYILKLQRDGIDINKWVKNLHGKGIYIKNYGYHKAGEIRYYYKKFLMFQESSYFSSIDRKYKFSGTLNADSVKRGLANTNQLTFEVTDACNLKCEYCGYGKFYDDYDTRENKNLSVDIAKNILRYFVKQWNSSLNTSHKRDISIGFYGGEPLLNMPFIKEIIGYARGLKLLHNYFTFSMTTNALLLEKYMDFIVEHDFNLLISLDGNAKNTGYRVLKNGKPAYDYIMKNVIALKNKYPKYFEKRVNFNAVLHNKNSVSEIYHYFKERFDKVAAISSLNTSGIRNSQKEEFRKTYRSVEQSWSQSEDCVLILNEMFIRLPKARRLAFFIHRYSGSVYRDYKQLLYSLENTRLIPTGTCLPFSRKVFVTVNGKLLPCEHIGQQYTLGHADEKNIDIDFEDIAQKYNRYYDKLRQRCFLCFFAELCGECVFNLNIDDKSPRCGTFMNYNAFSQYLSSQMSYLEEEPRTYARIMKEVVFA